MADEHLRVLPLVLPASSLPRVTAPSQNDQARGNALNVLSWKAARGEHGPAVPKNPGASCLVAGCEAVADLLRCIEGAASSPDFTFISDLFLAVGARDLAADGGEFLSRGDSRETDRDIAIGNAMVIMAILPLSEQQLGQE